MDGLHDQLAGLDARAPELVERGPGFSCGHGEISSITAGR
jgi:hypothetical protein